MICLPSLFVIISTCLFFGDISLLFSSGCVYIVKMQSVVF